MGDLAERAGSGALDDTVLTTKRLVLRGWRDSDRPLFAELNADPEVMAYFPSRLSREQSDGLIDAFEAERERRGFCPFAVELRDDATFVGFVGLHTAPDYLPFTPAIEIGWRLGSGHWGRGYAIEAARAAAAHGFGELSLQEIVSFTARLNVRSRAVMERLKMTHDAAQDFEHPLIKTGEPLRHHVLYRLRAP